jgi:hypothetical protein
MIVETRRRLPGLSLMLCAALVGLSIIASQAVGGSMTITIIANPGPFESIAVAAESEALVNFWDADQADDDACTECFAATELAHYMALASTTTKEELELAWPERLPQEGYVIVIGSRASNICIH